MQSLGIAVAICLLFVLGLLMVVVDSASHETESFLTVKVADAYKKSDSSSHSPSSPAANPASSSFAKMDVATTFFQVMTAPAPLAIETANESFTVPDPASQMGPSVKLIDFADAEAQKRKRIEEFVSSEASQQPSWITGGLGGTDLQPEILGSVFGNEFGEGSHAVIYLDVSGSMQAINRDVADYMDKHFPGALVREVNGCSMRQASHPFPSALLTEPERNTRTDFYFVCDLKDGESERVISAMRRFLSSGTLPRRLHIVSFDRAPRRHLSGLLTTPGSSLIMARGLNPPVEP